MACRYRRIDICVDVLADTCRRQHMKLHQCHGTTDMLHHADNLNDQFPRPQSPPGLCVVRAYTAHAPEIGDAGIVCVQWPTPISELIADVNR